MTDDLEGSLSDGTWFLDGSAGTTGSARDRTRDFLAAAPEPVPERACQNALLVVSELVGNAVRHAPGPCTLALDLTRRALTIGKRDVAMRTCSYDGAWPEGDADTSPRRRGGSEQSRNPCPAFRRSRPSAQEPRCIPTSLSPCNRRRPRRPVT